MSRKKLKVLPPNKFSCYSTNIESPVFRFADQTTEMKCNSCFHRRTRYSMGKKNEMGGNTNLLHVSNYKFDNKHNPCVY